jgi:hypothetical protein
MAPARSARRRACGAWKITTQDTCGARGITVTSDVPLAALLGWTDRPELANHVQLTMSRPDTLAVEIGNAYAAEPCLEWGSNDGGAVKAELTGRGDRLRGWWHVDSWESNEAAGTVTMRRRS